MISFLLSLLLVSGTAHADLLSDKIPAPFYTVQEGGQNQVMFVDDGISALQLRLDMIRRAKKTIEVEYFIYNTDTASRIFSKELVSAAARGVKVRVLIDKSKPIFVFDPYYVKEMADRGVEFRYYNAAGLWRISSEQFRDHRKLIVIDDAEAITGGRNISNEYFDLSPTFNFTDADIYVRGPMSKVMRETFDKYYENHVVQIPKYPKKPKAALIAKARAFFNLTPDETAARARLETVGASVLAATPIHSCPTLTYSTDAPGADFGERIKPGFVDRFRFLRKTLYDKIAPIDRRLVIASPYIIDHKNADELMNLVLSNKAKIELYTNSLGSTDAVYVAANMYLGLRHWRKLGIDVYFHDGKWIPKNPETPAYVREADAGLHSKVQVYMTSKYSEVMVGTYNVDHRSNYYNAEMALFCKGNPAFTKEVLSVVRGDEAEGLRVSADASYVTDKNGERQSVYAATASKLKKMKFYTWVYWLARELL